MKKVIMVLAIVCFGYICYPQQIPKYAINDRTIEIINNIMKAQNATEIKRILNDTTLCTSNREYLPKGVNMDSMA
ncbi:MAG: hypothetical protein JNJ85_03700, partial [Candidatus Kapabacteria bacterium]|nr:hypothetical protein [Candidatus Kapabacteria bacterium]